MGEIKNMWVDRYLYDVTRRLPEKQRADIEEELRTLIEDMLEERAGNGKTEEQNITEILETLGSPVKLADKYRGQEQHLIGGEYYSIYMQVVKIVLICVAAGMGIAAIVSLFVQISSAGGEILKTFIDSIVNLVSIPSAMFQAFGIVTFIFWRLEKMQVKMEAEQEVWTVKKLPEIPYKKALISRGDSISGIVFGILAAVFLSYGSEWIGIWTRNASGSIEIIPLFDQGLWNRVLPLILIAIIAGILEDIVKLIEGCYSYLVMWVNIAANIVSIGCVVWAFKGIGLWNIGFVTGLQTITGGVCPIRPGGAAAGIVSNIIMMVMIGLSLLDMGVTIYRTLSYGRKGSYRGKI